MSDQLFEHAVRDWLEDGSDRTPPPAIEAVLLAVKTTPQERVLWIPRRFTLMSNSMRLAAAVALVALAGTGTLLLSGGGGGPTPSPVPTASPVPSPTASPSPTVEPINTTDWSPYTSTRYGFTISHPLDWTVFVAERDWTFETDIEAWTSRAPESFTLPVGEGVKTSAWSVAVTPGTTAESWLQAFCDGTNTAPCPSLEDAFSDVETGDGHPGVLWADPVSQTMAAFVDGQTVYVVAVWRGESDRTVLPFGGARRLLEAFLSTLTLPAPVASPAAS